MKLAGTVILYYPDINLMARIKTYINMLEVLYVVDNTESNDINIKNEILKYQKVKYLHDGKNKGIAMRLNEVAETAIKDGHSALLTMDQDSSFDLNMAQQYLDCIENFTSYKITAMFGVEFLHQPQLSTCTSEKVSELITSGSILNLDLFKNIGKFDEKLFIDYVDHEYCYRAITRGYDIIKLKNIFLQHSVGETVRKRSPVSLKYTERSFHSSVRIYYMVRNYLYVKSRYNNSFPVEMKHQQKSILTRIKNKLLYSNERFKLLRLIFRAFKDYKQERMGKMEL
ncbi:glycosyltransferase family 2 protein [soil metagenome]